MPLQKLQFRPGINKESTSFANEGGWVDCDKVRFRMGYPEKINGWETKTSGFIGACRALKSWQSLSLERYTGLGTHLKYFVEEGNLFYDITPIRETTAAGDVVISYEVNLVSNGNFIKTSPGSTSIDDWTNTNNAFVIDVGGYIDGGTIQNPSNNNIASALGVVGSLSQSVTTQPNVEYTLTFMVLNPSQPVDSSIVVTGSSELVNTSITAFSPGATGSEPSAIQTVTFTADSASTEIKFVSETTSCNLGFSQVLLLEPNPKLNELTVRDTNHGCRAGDFVTFSGATGLGGNITAEVMNQEYQVSRVISTSEYKVNARTGGTPLSNYYSEGTVVIPESAEVDGDYWNDTDDSGTATVGEYQINSGLDTSVFGDGWGAGTWSRGAWNSAASLSILIETLRLWQHDTFGEDLIMNIRSGGIYYWDASIGTSARAVALEDLVGASNAPTVANKVLVSDIDRHVIAFGANPLGSSTQDPLLIRFSDQENAADWTPTTTNTAGDLRLGTGSEIVTAVETRQQILIFTDQSMHTMQFLGPPYTFGVNMVAENITIRSPNAAVSVEDSVFWMGTSEFMVYRGTVQNLNCTLKEYVFDDLNLDQAEKVFAAANTGFGEVWWFYPSGTSLNVDKYVVYNYEQDIWYHGSLDRSAWIDSGLADYPLATDNKGSIYFHEFGIDGDGQAIEAHVESSPIDIGEGDQFSYATSILPDISFRDSSISGLPHSVTFNIKGYNYNGGTTLPGQDDNHVVSTSDVSLERFDGKKDIRVRGRSLSLKVSSDSIGTTWRLGIPRINIRTDGKR